MKDIKREANRIRRKNKRKVRPAHKETARAFHLYPRASGKDRETGRRDLEKEDLPGKDMEQYFDVLA